MSTRNIAWLIAIVAVGVVVWIAVGAWWGVLAALVTLVVSELVERSVRRRRRAERGESGGSPVRSAIATRRRRR